MSTARKSLRGRRPKLQLELLEKRCVLSFAGLDLSLPSIVSSLSYTGAGLAAAEVQDNGEPLPGWILGEGSETFADAPGLSVVSGSSVVLLGYVGNSLLLDASSQDNDVDVFRLDVGGTEELVLHFDLVAQSAGSGLDPTLTIVDSNGTVLASWEGTPAYGGGSERLDVFRTLGLGPGSYYVLVSSAGAVPAGGAVALSTPLSSPSGSGRSTGAYALRIRATEYTGAASLASVSISDQSDIHEPLTISLTFTGQVDPNTLAGGVVLRGPGGETYDLIWTGYDASTGVATYVPSMRLPNGEYTVEVDTNQIRDLAGHGLSGPTTATITIAAPAPTFGEGAQDASSPIDVGYLYTDELHDGVVLHGTAQTENDTDAFLVTLPGNGLYTFRLDGESNATLVVKDAQGNLLLTVEAGSAGKVLLEGGPLTIEVVSQGEGTYSASVTTEAWPEVPINLDIPVPDLRINLAGAGAALPGVGTNAPSDPAVRFVTDPTVQRVLELIEPTYEETGNVAAAASQQSLPVRQDAADTPENATPPLLVFTPFARGVADDTTRYLLAGDALRLEQRVATSMEPRVELSAVDAFTYAIRTLWSPSPLENELAAEIDWADFVRGLHEPNSGTIAELTSSDPAPAEKQAVSGPSWREQDSAPGFDEGEVADTAELVATAALGTGFATTPPVRRSLAALLHRIAQWLGS